MRRNTSAHRLWRVNWLIAFKATIHNRSPRECGNSQLGITSPKRPLLVCHLGSYDFGLNATERCTDYHYVNSHFAVYFRKNQLMMKLLNLIASLGSESQSAITWPLLVELWHQVQSQLLADGVLLHRILATAYFMSARYSTASGSLS